MDLDLDALLQRTKLALANSRILDSSENYVQPMRTQFAFEFLANEPIHRTNFIVMHHMWLDSMDRIPTAAFIMHGHSMDTTCYAPYFCHQFGYWPTELHSPRFRKQFNLKWKYIYDSKGWEIE